MYLNGIKLKDSFILQEKKKYRSAADLKLEIVKRARAF